MDYNLVVDSCCDMPLDMQEEQGVLVVPLSITIDEKLFIDDEQLNIEEFRDAMKHGTTMTSGAPSPASYLDKFKSEATNFVVTLSSKLSGSFSSAFTASNIAQENNCDVQLIDSKSASAGQMLVIRKLKELIAADLEKSEIIRTISTFADNVKTYFVSQDLSNLVKNGRLNKVKGKILTAFGIRPILGSNGNGEISLFSHCRGDNQTLKKLVELINTSCKETQGRDIVITHCNNMCLADRLQKAIQETFQFRRIIVAETRALSSMYANNQGLIMAF